MQPINFAFRSSTYVTDDAELVSGALIVAAPRIPDAESPTLEVLIPESKGDVECSVGM